MSTNGKVGGFLVAFALLLYFVLIPNYIVESRVISTPGMHGALSSRLFPAIIAVGLGILGLLLVVSDLLARKESKTGEQSKPVLVERTTVIRVGILFLLCLVYYYVTLLLGYILATILMLPVIMGHFGVRNKKVMVLTAILLPIIVYIVFAKLMQVPLPTGIIF